MDHSKVLTTLSVTTDGTDKILREVYLHKLLTSVRLGQDDDI